MTEKRWLIRTRSKQILGPASKEKIISLIEKESLHEDDELSSGNGYWFWVKESDLVEKYLYNSERQGFNPVTECQSVLESDDAVPITTKKEVKLEAPAQEIKKEVKQEVKVNEDSEFVIPNEEDLEFPDLGLSSSDENDDEEEMSLDHTSVMTLDQLSRKSSQLDNDSDDQAVEDSEAELLEVTREIKPLPKKEVEKEAKPLKSVKKKETKKNARPKKVIEKQEIELEESPKKQVKKTRNDRYLFLLLIFICLLLFSVFYYYRTIVNKPIPIIGIANVHAQSLTSLVKKKVQSS